MPLNPQFAHLLEHIFLLLLSTPILLHPRVASLDKRLHAEIVEPFERFNLLLHSFFFAFVDLSELLLLRFHLLLTLHDLVN